MKKIKKSDIDKLCENLSDISNTIGLIKSGIAMRKHKIEQYEQDIARYEDDVASKVIRYKGLKSEYGMMVSQYEEQRRNAPLTARQALRLKEVGELSHNTVGKVINLPYNIKNNMNLLKPFVFLIESGYMTGDQNCGYIEKVALTQRGLDKVNENKD